MEHMVAQTLQWFRDVESAFVKLQTLPVDFASAAGDRRCTLQGFVMLYALHTLGEKDLSAAQDFAGILSPPIYLSNVMRICSDHEIPDLNFQKGRLFIRKNHLEVWSDHLSASQNQSLGSPFACRCC